MQNLMKIEQKYCTETNSHYKASAITLCLFDEINLSMILSMILNHSSPISTLIQCLKKEICQKMLKIESGNEVVTDGRSNEWILVWVLSGQESVRTQQFPENFNGINLILSLLAPFMRFIAFIFGN